MLQAAINEAPQPILSPQAKREGVPMEVLAFTVGKEEYGINIQHVQELRGYEAVTTVPDAPAFVKGFINLRGTIVPIVDMRIKFHLGEPTYDQFTVVIVVNVGKHTIGMVVDSVSDVCALKPEQIRPMPDMGAALATDFLMGLGLVDRCTLILIDIDKLVRDTDIGLFAKTSA